MKIKILFSLEFSATVYSRQTLVWLRDTEDVEGELARLVAGSPGGAGRGPVWRDPPAPRLLGLVFAVMLTNQLCGVNVILTFTVPIFKYRP